MIRHVPKYCFFFYLVTAFLSQMLIIRTWNTYEILRHCNCIINVVVIMWFYCTVTWNEVTAMSLLRPFRTKQRMCYVIVGYNSSNQLQLGNNILKWFDRPRWFWKSQAWRYCEAYHYALLWSLSAIDHWPDHVSKLTWLDV